jgi:hypothetical protein
MRRGIRSDGLDCAPNFPDIGRKSVDAGALAALGAASSPRIVGDLLAAAIAIPHFTGLNLHAGSKE